MQTFRPLALGGMGGDALTREGGGCLHLMLGMLPGVHMEGLSSPFDPRVCDVAQ
jgi:hypothetical protein